MRNLGKKVMMLISWLRRRKDFKNSKKKIDLKNILNYIEAEYQYWKSTSDFAEASVFIQDQSIYRLDLIQKKSPKCLIQSAFCTNCNQLGSLNEECCHCEKGHYLDDPALRCRSCGCNTIEKTFGKLGCEEGCFPDRMNEEDWNNFKITNNVDIISKGV